MTNPSTPPHPMHIQLSPLSARPQFLEAALRLYTSAFPRQERRDEEDWLCLVRHGNDFQAWAIESDGQFCGFITIWEFPFFAYVEHFAIEPSLRGSGIGASVLASVREKYKETPLVLEAELPDAEIAQRRVRFYHRNGFATVDHDYSQPPYREGDPWLPLLLMSTETDYVEDNFAAVSSLIHRYVYGMGR